MKTAYWRQIKDTLSTAFPREAITAYRYNSVSYRVRIIDERFRGLSYVEREKLVLPLIHRLPKAIQAEITVLLMLAPEETGSSLRNLEFEQRTRSRL